MAKVIDIMINKKEVEMFYDGLTRDLDLLEKTMLRQESNALRYLELKASYEQLKYIKMRFRKAFNL